MTSGARFSGNPFPGLRPFEADEEHLFFGREVQTDELLSRLRRKRFVAVVGASGSGKSSLVRAGLLPSLYGGFMAGAGSHWYVAVMRPGRAPIVALANALHDSGALGVRPGDPVLQVGLAQAVLERGALGLVEAVADARLRPGENLLIVVDQFEELFRFKSLDAVAFVKLLLSAVSQSQCPIYVVITMRSDFLGDVSQFRGLPETISESLFLVPRLTRTQFQRAIEGPIRVAGGSIAPRLTNRLLNDLQDDADQLPVLQHALMRTWEAHCACEDLNEPLDIVDLEAIGALSEALSRHGDEIYAALPTDRLRLVAERVFKCVTERADDNRGARRPTRFSDLCNVVEASKSEAGEVLDAFRAPACSFLMPPAGQSIDDDSMIDVSHESLMHIWKRLQRWVDEEAQSAQIYRRLAVAAVLYREGKTALWRDPDLEIAAGWRELSHPTTPWAERISPDFGLAMQFLDASLDERDRERRLRASRSRMTLATLCAVAIILAGLSTFAFSQWRIAKDSLLVERAEYLADAGLHEPVQRRSSTLLTVDAYGMKRTGRTAGAMLEELMRLHALRGAAIASVTAEAFARRGELLAVASKSVSAPSRLTIFNALTLGVIASGPLEHVTKVTSICGASDGDWFALSDGHSVSLYQGLTNHTIEPIGPHEVAHVDAMACLPQRRAVAVVEASRIRVVDFTSGAQRLLASAGRSALANIVASPSGPFIAMLSSGSNDLRIDLLDQQSDKRMGSITLPGSCSGGGRCISLAFSPNGRRLAWSDGSSINSAAVPALSNVSSRSCRCRDGILAFNADGSGPRAIQNGLSDPIYDANTETLVTHDDGGVTEFSADGISAPALGDQDAPVWPGSFASIGDRLVLAGSNGIHVYDLNRYRAQLATASDVSRRVRISDPGDGIHAVGFDYLTGGANIFSVGPPLRVTAAIRVRPAETPAYSDEPEVAFNPIERPPTLTEASIDGITRYELSGNVVEKSSWQRVATAAALPGWLPGIPYFLSGRGSYVRLLPPASSDVPMPTSGNMALVATAGGLVARFASAPIISPDESFAIGLRADNGEAASDIYALRGLSATRWGNLDLPDFALAAISPNKKTIAYTSLQQSAAADIQLFDVALDARIGPTLTAPLGMRSVEHLSFSDDNRFLFASYRGAHGVPRLVVYSVDPTDWQRTLCLWAGSGARETSVAEKERAARAPDSCAKYRAEMAPSN